MRAGCWLLRLWLRLWCRFGLQVRFIPRFWSIPGQQPVQGNIESASDFDRVLNIRRSSLHVFTDGTDGDIAEGGQDHACHVASEGLKSVSY